MEYSRTDEKALAATAHEILREISSGTPEVLKAHIQEICKTLEDEAPSRTKSNEVGAVDDLKACASFALKFPKEISQDRNFLRAMKSFAMYGSPPEAAKQAVSIIMAASDKKELFAKELLQMCIKGFEYGVDGFLSRLATLSQLMLLAPDQVDRESDAIVEIAIKHILLQVRTPSTESPDEYRWSPEVDAECSAKCWALKILVNRVRSTTDSTLAEIAEPVYNLLSTLIIQDGEMASEKNTPATHKPRLRLLAARLYLKLCIKRPHDALLSPAAFNALAVVAQDTELYVRAGFLQRLRKYLGQQKLAQRFYTIPFLLAFEPNDQLKNETATWIRSRAVLFSTLKAQPAGSASSGKANTLMESVFARFLSLLAHHPDFDTTTDNLLDFARYIIFYLQNVATDENISLIYHVAQRVKQCRDAILPRASTDDTAIIDDYLYHLSDLAQLTIREFEDVHSWSIQTLPAKIRLPASLFSEIKSHQEAQRIAEHNHLPEGVEEGIEALVRRITRKSHGSKKRRSEGGDNHPEDRERKRAKRSPPLRKAGPKEKKAAVKIPTRTPKRPPKRADDAAASSERRTSGRVRPVGGKTYAERDSEDDDEEMEVLEWEVDGEVMPSKAFSNGDEEEDVASGPRASLTAKSVAKAKMHATDALESDSDIDRGPDSMESDPFIDRHPPPVSKSKNQKSTITKSTKSTPRPTTTTDDTNHKVRSSPRSYREAASQPTHGSPDQDDLLSHKPSPKKTTGLKSKVGMKPQTKAVPYKELYARQKGQHGDNEGNAAQEMKDSNLEPRTMLRSKVGALSARTPITKTWTGPLPQTPVRNTRSRR